MTQKYLEDLKFQVKHKLLKYLKASQLPVDETDPEHPTTICPCCGQMAKILKLDLAQCQEWWSCSFCNQRGEAVSFAMHYFGFQTEADAILDVCHKLGVKVEHLRIVTATELLEMDFPPLQELIEGMLAPGVYILAGKSKIGKSWLVLQIALHLSSGQPMWGRRVTQCEVLYLTLLRLQSRLLRLWDEETGPVYIATEAELLENGLENQIRNHMKNYPATKLVIVDTLQKIREKCFANYSYADDYATMSAFKRLATQLDICILIVHHTRKLQANDIMDMISGTTGLMGSADGAMVMDRPERAEGKATLCMTSRDFSDAVINLKRNVETMYWEFDGYADEQETTPVDPVIRAIISLIEDNITWTGTAEMLTKDLLSITPTLNIKPNTLSRKLNAEISLLKNEYGIACTRKRSAEGKLIFLQTLTDMSDDDDSIGT